MEVHPVVNLNPAPNERSPFGLGDPGPKRTRIPIRWSPCGLLRYPIEWPCWRHVQRVAWTVVRWRYPVPFRPHDPQSRA